MKQRFNLLVDLAKGLPVREKHRNVHRTCCTCDIRALQGRRIVHRLVCIVEYYEITNIIQLQIDITDLGSS